MTSSAYRQALAAMRKSAADAETVRVYAQAPGSGTIPAHGTQYSRRAMMAQENYNAKVARRGVGSLRSRKWAFAAWSGRLSSASALCWALAEGPPEPWQAQARWRR